MSRLGDCVRCFDPRPATTAETLTTGHGTYRLPLCDPHADMLQRDLMGWTRVGIIVDDSRPSAFKTADTTRRRGTVTKMHLEVPGQSVPAQAAPARPTPVRQAPVPAARQAPVARQAPPLRPVEPVRTPEPAFVEPVAPVPAQLTLAPPALPAGYEDWVFSAHALDRQVSRKVSRAEALWTALEPDSTWPGLGNPGTQVCRKAHVQVVINPAQKRIITVIDIRVTSEQEEETHAAAQ